jgi:hypothetical protein
MDKITEEIIDRVKESLPITKVFQRSNVKGQIDSKLMSDVGLSFRAYGEFLEQVAEEYTIEENEIAKNSPKSRKRGLFGLLASKETGGVELRVPDLTIAEIAQIVRQGYWPENFYIERSA